MLKHSTQTVTGKTAGKSAAAPVRVAVAQEAFRHNEALYAALDTSAAGLNEEQITERLDRDGLNEVSHEKPPHWSVQLLRLQRVGVDWAPATAPDGVNATNSASRVSDGAK